MQWIPNALSPFVYYAAPAVLIWSIYGLRKWSRERRARKLLRESQEARLLEPPSLHPLINPNKCAGCATCVDACPEGDVLGVIDRKAVLVSPANCIGHGACKTACPMDAITLVFGTATRGIDLPLVGENFEANVPGLFIAGELGGMGLIRNAVEQGRQAIDEVAKGARSRKGNELDVVIVGAGPAGIAASLGAKQRGLRSVTVEQETLGGTVAHYPRGKIVMTAPVQLPIYGRVKLRETTKEALLELWTKVVRETGLEIRYGERMVDLTRTSGGFEVSTTEGKYRASCVLLCLGRRGTPRKLGVPGESRPKVVYRLSEPEQFAGRNVLVVGGGDSAIEAANTLGTEVHGTTVTLSYRGAAFERAKSKNRARLEKAQSAGAVSVLLESRVLEIGSKSVRIEHARKKLEIPNDVVIVCAGGVLPTELLKSVGIEIETKRGTA